MSGVCALVSAHAAGDYCMKHGSICNTCNGKTKGMYLRPTEKRNRRSYRISAFQILERKTKRALCTRSLTVACFSTLVMNKFGNRSALLARCYRFIVSPATRYLEKFFKYIEATKRFWGTHWGHVQSCVLYCDMTAMKIARKLALTSRKRWLFLSVQQSWGIALAIAWKAHAAWVIASIFQPVVQ